MKLKKLSIISLICMMCFTFLPVNLYALEGDATTDSTVEESVPVEDVITEDDAEARTIACYKEDLETFDLRDYSFTNTNSSSKRGMTTVTQSAFTANEKALYDAFLPELAKMADGDKDKGTITVNVASLFPKQTFTKEELGVSSLVTGNALSDEAFDAIYKKLNVDLNKVLYALISNKPYEMYWFDKTNIYTTPMAIRTTLVNDSIDTSKTEMDFGFIVVKDYSATGQTKTVDFDTAKTKSVGPATKAKAQEVVAEVTKNSKTHYEILKAYKDWVCSAVDYNKSISLTDDYGNPWQMIWVFDNDPSTNIVCEGYAKAFKYLCDLTPELTNDGIEVYLMLGDLGGSGMTTQPHMWNVVHMNNGKNYLVDCTNMDPQTVDPEWVTNNFLFMVGAPKQASTNSDGGAADMYSFSAGKVTATFTYGPSVMSLNTAAERDLDSTNYDPSSSVAPSNPSTPTTPTTPTEDPTPTTDDPVVEDPTTTDDPVVTVDDDADDDDSVIDEEDEDKDSDSKGASTVKTGDETNMVVYAVLLVVALALVIGLVVYNRKKNKKE